MCVCVWVGGCARVRVRVYVNVCMCVGVLMDLMWCGMGVSVRCDVALVC